MKKSMQMAAYEADACTAEPFPLDARLGLQNRQVESARMVAEMPFQQYGWATEGEMMLKRALVLVILGLIQTGCSIEEGGGAYTPIPMTQEGIEYHEPNKREFLKIEDLSIGSGPLATWGRKISADIDVRYTDGTIVYRGPMFLYLGFSPFIHNALKEAGALNIGQYGIWLGINGMAVGGKRRITIEPQLVDSGLLVTTGHLGKERVGVRKEKLIVEATLTASCIPVLLRALHVNVGYVLEREIWCRNADLPTRDPSDPIWRFY